MRIQYEEGWTWLPAMDSRGKVGSKVPRLCLYTIIADNILDVSTYWLDFSQTVEVAIRAPTVVAAAA